MCGAAEFGVSSGGKNGSSDGLIGDFKRAIFVLMMDELFWRVRCACRRAGPSTASLRFGGVAPCPVP